MNILVCDDDELIREIVALMLRNGRHQVEIAIDGQDALEKIQSNPNSFDALVTDFKMPRLSGVELVERLREMKNPLKVIMITGYSDEVKKGALDRLGLNGFLKKPFKMPELLDCVNALGR